MKNSYIISTIIASCMVFNFSCQDLDEDPVGLLSPEGLFNTPGDVALSVNGGYSLIGHENFWGRKLSLSLLLRGDMVSIGDLTTAGRRIEVDQMNMSANNGMVSAFWPKGYEALAALNVAIQGAENVTADEAELNAVVAEARFLRAFIHYNFVRLFGDIPYVDSTISNPEDAYSWPESSEDEVYAGIISDLEYAKQWLPDVSSTRSRPGKGTAASFLASVHLTRGDYQDAYDEAKYVIDNSGTFGYALEGEFADLFDPSIGVASNEVIFEIDFIGADAGGNPSDLGGTNAAIDYIPSVTGPRGDERFVSGEGWSVAVPSLAVFNGWDERDYRRSVSFDTVLINGGVEVPYTGWDALARNVARPHIAKYFRALGQTGLEAGSNGRDSDVDYIIMRYAEVLLIAAEALNEVSGPSAEADGYVNQVRARARREMDADGSNDRTFPADVAGGLSQDQFRDLVLEERRLELAFEFGRWYDIKRRNLGDVAFSTSGLDPQNFSASKDYYFPKYQQDVDLNDNLHQNTGY